MILPYSDACKSVNVALKKFGAKEVSHWLAEDGSMQYEFVLPSGTGLFLRLDPIRGGEYLQVKWVWELH